MLGLDGDVNYTHSYPIAEEDLYLVGGYDLLKIYGSRITELSWMM